MDIYDRSGGGLVAGGLAYTSLLALLPGFLLLLSVVGFVVRDPAVQDHIVAAVAQTLPPFEEVASLALAGVSTNALPTGIFAIVTLLWGSSRLYANLDTAFSRIFLGAPRRNPVVQTIRGLVLTVILILVPVVLVTVGSMVSWLGQFAPEGLDVGRALAVFLDLASPLGSLVAFVLATALCYRYVPSDHVPWRAIRLPAASIGLVLAVFTQIYVFIAPRLMGLWALYGTALAIIGLLAWLSIAFNVLLVGAAWTEARARLGLFAEVWPGGAGPVRLGNDADGPPSNGPSPKS
jgi:membrane protein